MSQINCVWASLADCVYERFPPGFLIKVVFPDEPPAKPTRQVQAHLDSIQELSAPTSKYCHQQNVKLIPSDAVIKTRLFDNLSSHLAGHREGVEGRDVSPQVFDMQRPTCKVCAHFLYKGQCNRGAECQFVHPVHIAANGLPMTA